MKSRRTYYIVSLGCPKNRVDSERILAVMSAADYSFTDDRTAADVIIVNTCAFIQEAVQESVNAILDLSAENPEAFLVVAGCLPMRYKVDLQESLPEVGLFLSPDSLDELPKILKASGRLPAAVTKRTSRVPRIVTTPGYAYLRIAEGCFRNCAYCAIPSIRGPLRSEPQEKLVNEARFLVERGAVELVLVAQDLTAYGKDQGRKNALIELLAELDAISGLRWIRLLYLYPEGIPQDLPKLINQSPKILPYLDIPLQHVSQKVLKSMRRPGKPETILKRIDRLRNDIPRLVLRSTLMVGFPTEGEDEFRQLESFVATCGIDHLGFFIYSPEEGTAAFRLGDPVPAKVKRKRAATLRSIHSKFLRKRNKAKVGAIEECLVEGVSPETELLLQGRLWDQAPEVDGSLFITAGLSAEGEIHKVRITDAHKTDLFGEIVE